MRILKYIFVLLIFVGWSNNLIGETTMGKIVVAHRGGAALGLENTLSCISKGLDAGAQWIEIDVHLSADGQVVVCHDETVKRTTNGTGYISELSYSEIRTLKVVDTDGNESNEYIPLLDEVLRLIKGKAKLLLEIKHTSHSLPGIENACIEIIKQYDMLADVVVQSFEDDVIKTVHALEPAIRVEKLLLVGPPFWFDFDKYSYVSSFNVYYNLLSKRFLDEAHRRGKEVKVWTLNKIDYSLLHEVDGVITNNPTLFVTLFEK